MEISEALVAQQQVVRLQALLEASRQLHSTIELDEVLRVALQIVVLELELTGAFFSTFPHTYGEVSPYFRPSSRARQLVPPTSFFLSRCFDFRSATRLALFSPNSLSWFRLIAFSI